MNPGFGGLFEVGNTTQNVIEIQVQHIRSIDKLPQIADGVRKGLDHAESGEPWQASHSATNNSIIAKSPDLKTLFKSFENF